MGYGRRFAALEAEKARLEQEFAKLQGLYLFVRSPFAGLLHFVLESACSLQSC